MGCGASVPVRPAEGLTRSGSSSRGLVKKVSAPAIVDEMHPAVREAIALAADSSCLDLSLPTVPISRAAELRFPPLLTVPLDIMHLSLLKTLSLKNHRLQVLPDDFFAELTGLVSLDLSQNTLHVLPSSVSGCVGLQELDISENLLGSLPDLSPCSKLRSLIMFKNSLESFPETFFNGMNELAMLNCFNNKLSRLPEGVGLLPAIEELSLGSNKLRNLPTPSGEGWRLLRRLGAMDNRLTSPLPSLAACASTIAMIQLAENQLTELPSFDGQLAPMLEVVELQTNKIADVDQSFAECCPALKTLNLRANAIVGVLPPAIIEFQGLEVLNLEINDLAKLPNSIGGMGAIKSLLLSKNPRLAGLPSTLLRCPNLSRLMLMGCPLVGADEEQAALMGELEALCFARGGLCKWPARR